MRDQCKNYEGAVVVDFLLSQLLDNSKKFESRRTIKLQATLRLAAQFEQLLASNLIKNRAALARRYGMTRARVTQLLALLALHPDIRAYVESVDPESGTILSERQLRPILALDPDAQLTTAADLLPGFARTTGDASLSSVAS